MRVWDGRIGGCQSGGNVRIIPYMRSRIVPAVLLLAFLQAAFAQVQLIQNGGFESTSQAPWVFSGTGVGIATGTNANGGFPYDGAQYLSMGNSTGQFQSAYQTITFPTNLIGATLSLYYQIVSTDPNYDDTLTIDILDANGNFLEQLGSITSASITDGYVEAATNFISYRISGDISSYAGETVRVEFYVTTDSTYGSLTSFGIDDVSLVAGTTADIPSNDNFTNATPILTSSIANDVNTTYASKETGEPNHAGNAGGHSLWWTWTAPSIGVVAINTTGSSFNTLLAVYTNSSPSNVTFRSLAGVSSNNGVADSSGLASVRFTLATEAQVGTQYYIALDGYDGESGSAVFNFTFSRDTTPPKVLTFSPASGTVVSNTSVLVKGTASDNVAVAGVEYRLANAAGTNAWQFAAGTTNWSATVTNLIPGPNTVTVEAIDTSSNISALVSHAFDYDVPAPLKLATNGRGAVSISGAASIAKPTNGQPLDLGFTYILTAKAASGFAFTNWTGGTNANPPFGIFATNARLSFQMESNLTLIANFVDVTPPGISISSPTKDQRWSNSTFTATGTAKDNVQVSNVLCQLNGSGWTLATPGDTNWTNWKVTLTPLESSNLFEAYSVATTGNISPTNKITFFYIPSAKLAVQTNGLGGITPVDNGKMLAIGTNYTLTASPGHNYIFSNWVASGSANFVSNSPKLSFTMQSNLALAANFVTNVFLAAQGTYNGLFAPADAPRRQTNSGAITLSVTGTGAFSGKLTIGADTPSLTGQFDPAGAATTTTHRKGQSNLITTLQLDFAGQTVSGAVTDGSFVAQVIADLDVFNSTRKATNYEGRYTFIIPGTNHSGVGPLGTSCGTATVSSSGAVTFTVNLADGTTAPVNPSGVVSKDGWWPFYLPLYSGNGSLWSWNCFTNGGLMSSTHASWINATNASKTAQYRAGFTNETASIFGSAFNPASEPLLSLSNGQVTLQGVNWPLPITNQLILASNNKITITNAADTNKLALTINKANGVISGAFANPANPRQTLNISGVLLQNETNAQGYFIGTNQQNGSFLLIPQ